MSLTTPQLATELGQALEAHLIVQGGAVVIADQAAFNLDIASIFAGWAEENETDAPGWLGVALRTSGLIRLWNANQQQFRDWFSGSAEGGWDETGVFPGGGHYPLTNGVGITRYFPSIAKMVQTAGLRLNGVRNTVGELPNSGQKVGDAYLVQGSLYVWSGTQWVNAGPIVGPAGTRGWSPVYAVVADGARRVLRVADWVGGTGGKPDVGEYLGALGHVQAIAQAVDIRGPQGVQGIQGPQGVKGDKGETGESYVPDAVGTLAGRDAHDGEATGFGYVATDVPDPDPDAEPGATIALLFFRVGAPGGWSQGVQFGRGPKGETGDIGPNGWAPVIVLVSDGDRVVQQLADWVGGAGPKPPTGQFLREGGWTNDLALARDVRGPRGLQGIQGEQGNRGERGPQGEPLTVHAVDERANRGNYDLRGPGFVFLARDESNLYVRLAAGGWSAPAPLVPRDLVRVNVYAQVAGTAPVEQVINLPSAVTTLDELFIFQNGVEQGGIGITLAPDGLSVRLVREAKFTGNIIRICHVRGARGPQGNPGPVGPPGNAGPAAFKPIWMEVANPGAYVLQLPITGLSPEDVHFSINGLEQPAATYEIVGNQLLWTWDGEDGEEAEAIAWAGGPRGVSIPVSVIMPTPAFGTQRTLMRTPPDGLDVRRVSGVLLGGDDTRSVTCTLRFAGTRNAAGTELLAGGFTVTSAAQGNAWVADDLDTYAIPGDRWLWLEVSAVVGAPDELALTLDF